MSKNVIEVENVSRSFPVPGGDFWALKKINAEIPEGSFVILKGRSGSGKTTLLNLICTLDKPTEGIVRIDGIDVSKLTDHEKEDMRRTKMGFVFQSVSLIPSLNAFQNVEFSMRMAGIKPGKERDRRVEECLKLVGLGNRISHMPAEMSGGEQQRVAIARALAHKPKLILADEPTAELDSAMAARVAQLFAEMSKKEGISILMTTHDVGLMGAADFLIELENGERIDGRENSGN
ncbi:MAG: ABC transporter ATP-binding protein [Lachnospiraceae bacterium]|nr:ABC transporter ATP-binding protein [Lachnospiraceae bacterium]